MLQIKNETPFKANIAILPDADGIDTLYVAVRASFTIAGNKLAVAEEQDPVRLADEYLGDPGTSSLVYAADLHLGKPTTDVALIGEAWAPAGKAAGSVDVTLVVGPVRKVVRVFGAREWKGLLTGSISSPVPFDKMPLVYERAFGGVISYDEGKDQAILDWRNPVGRGPGLRKAPGDKLMNKLPNLEDPAHLISGPRDKPPPAGFGFIAPSWEPRRSLGGTYDEAWQDRRAPFLPKDFQPRFFNAAHPDLVCKRYLRGGEPVEVHNAAPAPMRFKLPVCEIDALVTVAGQWERPPVTLQTVVIEPSNRKLRMVWLAALGVDKRPLKVSEVKLSLDKLDLGGNG